MGEPARIHSTEHHCLGGLTASNSRFRLSRIASAAAGHSGPVGEYSLGCKRPVARACNGCFICPQRSPVTTRAPPFTGNGRPAAHTFSQKHSITRAHFLLSPSPADYKRHLSS